MVIKRTSRFEVEGEDARLVLPDGTVALLSTSDIPAVSGFAWYLCKATGRVMAHTKGSARTRKGVYLHRLILGPECEGSHVDHVNRDPLDNRRQNLRICTAHQNNMNRGKRKTNTSGFLGVDSRPNGKFRARVGINSKRVCIGDFDTAEEAAEARDMVASRLHGEFAALNHA